MQMLQTRLQDLSHQEASLDVHSEQSLSLDSDGTQRVDVRRNTAKPNSVALSLPDTPASNTWVTQPPLLLRLIERAFAALRDTNCISLDRDLIGLTLHGDHELALLSPDSMSAKDGALNCERKTFFQSAAPWLRSRCSSSYPLTSTTEIGKIKHPLRPPEPAGLVYERFDPTLGMTVSFRAIDRERDLGTFHNWMNDGRVAFFWELAQSESALAEYLDNLKHDPHAFGLIGCFDGDPFGYFEIYWAKEDRLGSYYDADDFDRGWHGLVGNRRHLGHAKTLAWLRAVTHYLFIDDIRTRKVVGEPKASHTKLLRYADAVAYYKVKEFDFPHKRSALMHCDRETFFETVQL
ncbi:GNAT family N-acetyltransferase [Pelagibius sp. Alg239-R121]|uniref:GNAT family N-acetyltransferase n=1 Tax=Pelagibius sp. Alg239-R121 TaxID=2993448 RepID=UPI0024A67389|nr:GNAT family N-acetyltransferase [Pelagibius sp. Alg239-R121]